MSLRGRYLKSFDLKLAELRDSVGRLSGTGDAATASSELRRRLQTLAGSGDVYGVPEVSEWARDTLRLVDALRARTGSASAEDVNDLLGRINDLGGLVGRLDAGDSNGAGGPPALPVPLGEPVHALSEGPEDPQVLEERPATGPAPALAAESAETAEVAQAVEPAQIVEAAPTVPEHVATRDDWPSGAEERSAAIATPGAGDAVATPEAAPAPAPSPTPVPLEALPVAVAVTEVTPEVEPPERLERLSDPEVIVMYSDAKPIARPGFPLPAVFHTLTPLPDTRDAAPSVEHALLAASGGAPPIQEPFRDTRIPTPEPPAPVPAAPEPAAPEPAPTPGEPAVAAKREVREASEPAILMLEPDPEPRVGPPPLPVSPPLPIQEVAVLVIDTDEAVLQGIRDALSSKQYRVATTTDPEHGIEMAHSETPDLAFIGLKLGETSGFRVLERLRKDPLTQAVPVVFVTAGAELTERTSGLLAGAADYLPKPFDAADVVDRVQRIAIELGPEPEGVPDLGAAPLPEIVRFIEREMRRGLLDSAEVSSADLRIHLGRGGEILAATWAAVARVRELIARLSNGKVRFRAVDHGRLGVLALHAEDRVAVSSADAAGGPSADLAGRLVLVVDDDPAVRWLFTSVLGDVGATVETAADGKNALERARARRPDVIVSDILMPEMDGWELCRALRRDFNLRDIPIVLISWKEDFFQRMKELAAGADEYLLKEAQRTQIVDRLRQLLRPRALLEARLSVGNEVHGRVDATGILALIRAVARIRGDAKVSVRENWNLFELELRAGRPVACTRTATDGSFARSMPAFIEMLCIDGGRYSVGAAGPSVRPNLEGDLEEMVALGTHHINELVALIMDGALMRIAQIDLRADSIESYLRAAPERVRTVVQALQRRTTPRELVLNGSIGPQELERILLDLIKRGGVVAIEAPPAEAPPAPVTADERRWEILLHEERQVVHAPPPPPPLRQATAPSAVPAESRALPPRLPPPPPPSPGPQTERISLAPMTVPSVRPPNTQMRLAWTLVIVGAIVGAALWAYNIANMSAPAPRPTREERVRTDEDLEQVAEPIQALPDEEEAPARPSPGAEREPSEAVEVVEAPAPPAPARPEPPAPVPVRPPPPTPGSTVRTTPPTKQPPSSPRQDGGVARTRPAPAGEEAQGTLQVILGSPEAAGTEVTVDGQPKGTAPLTLTLSGGLHEVKLTREGRSTMRYAFVPAGESRRLIVPVF